MKVVSGRMDEVVDMALGVRLVTDLPGLREAFRSSKVDYPTNTDVVNAEVDGEFRFCNAGASRRPRRRGQKRELRDDGEPVVVAPVPSVAHGVTWDSVMTDAILRSSSEMKEIFKNEAERRAGWTLSEIFDVINRRYGANVEEWRTMANRQVEEFRNLRSDLRHLREENDRLRRRGGGATGVADPYGDPCGNPSQDPYAVRRYDPYAGISYPYASDPYADPYARRASEPYDNRAGPYSVRADPYASSSSGVRRTVPSVRDLPIPRSYGAEDDGYDSSGARGVADPYEGPSTYEISKTVCKCILVFVTLLSNRRNVLVSFL